MVGEAIRPITGNSVVSHILFLHAQKLGALVGDAFHEAGDAVGHLDVAAQRRLLEERIGQMARLHEALGGVFAFLVGVAGEEPNRLVDVLIEPGRQMHAQVDAANVAHGNDELAVLGDDLEVILQDGHADEAAVGEADLGHMSFGRLLGGV